MNIIKIYVLHCHSSITHILIMRYAGVGDILYLQEDSIHLMFLLLFTLLFYVLNNFVFQNYLSRKITTIIFYQQN